MYPMISILSQKANDEAEEITRNIVPEMDQLAIADAVRRASKRIEDGSPMFRLTDLSIKDDAVIKGELEIQMPLECADYDDDQPPVASVSLIFSAAEWAAFRAFVDHYFAAAGADR